MQLRDLEALNNMSEETRTLIFYALRSLNNDVQHIQTFCAGNNMDVDRFHNNLLKASNNVVEGILKIQRHHSLIKHFG